MVYRYKIKIHLNCTLKDTSAWEMCDAGASWCGGIRVDVAGRVGSTVCVCVWQSQRPLNYTMQRFHGQGCALGIPTVHAVPVDPWCTVRSFRSVTQVAVMGGPFPGN